MSLTRLVIARGLGALAALFLAASIASSGALAQGSDILEPGQPIITGFPGVVQADEMPDGSDPLDYSFIDPDGQSLVIQQLNPDAPPEGQLIDTATTFGASAADVGLVFGVALDDAPQTTGAEAPNIYVAATSAFGLHLVVDDADGHPVRVRTGEPGARFAPGQWGGAGGVDGYPGSIWKIDGTTGEVSLFTTIAANSGASLGALVFDASTQQFFVSDLDTGLIYRLAQDGTILDTFDHGIDGRPEHDLDAIADDGSAADITDPGFDTEDPGTWGFTQPERKVNGLAARGGRLFYAVAGQIWSVRLNDDGSFGGARWELDVTGLPSEDEITGIVFDPGGRMILAQRGAQVGSYDYSMFATPQTASVVRYAREFPDDPATPGTWAETPKSYAIGVGGDGRNAAGGVTLGYGFDADTGAFDGACSATLWATGDALRDNADLDPPLEGAAYVAGLQGVPRSWTRPLNDPPTLAAFTDFDGNTDDEQAALAGHVGAVAMWQVCEGAPDIDSEEPILPPDDYVPSPDVNLTLEKWASPHDCFEGAVNWWCSFTIRVENTGDTPYWGPLTISDTLPANNPGAVMDFAPSPPWACAPTGAASFECSRGAVLLFPGDGVTLHEVVKLPKAMVDYCHLANVAGIEWPFGLHDDEPGDDFDIGVASIDAPGCAVPAGATDLLLKKITFPANCLDGGLEWACSYAVMVQNAGPGNYTGPIQVQDTLGVNAAATTIGPWTCGQVGPVLTCDINAAPVNVPPGWTSAFLVTAHVPKNVGPPLCELDNKANIASPIGGPGNAIAGNDFDSVTAHIPDPACFGPQPDIDLEAKKVGQGCVAFWGGYVCEWKLTITNVGTDPYAGPLNFKDLSAGAVVNTLPTVAPFCAGAPVSVVCDLPAVLFWPGVPHSLTFYTAYNGGPAVCSVNNTLTIVNPSPGSQFNPAGNDSVTVAQALPNPACAGLPVLNIKKTAEGCAPDPSSPDWLCEFNIAVKNIGAANQPGPIQVKDFNSKPTTFDTPACVPSGVGQWTCTRPGPLNAGATWSFNATTRVDPNGVTLADCNVVNTVWISNPAAADPGHISQAEQKVPQLFINVGPGPVAVYCDPPSLKLEKTATKTAKAGDGYDATFRIKVTSTGPDPYHGTVELDEVLPDGATYVSSSWPCVPTTGNDVHCSSPYKDIPVGKYTTMTITMHIPEDVAVRGECDIVNTVNAAISAEVLHSDEGVQYTASASAKLPAGLCDDDKDEPAPQCPVNQVTPDGGCCETGLLWNGKQCARPQPKCPDDSHVNADGKCVCDRGTEGKPGKCEPIEDEPVTPVCPDDSHLNNRGQCVCDRGTEGKPGKCEPIEDEPVTPVCPDDSHLNNRGQCVCDRGTEGEPGSCEPIEDEPVTPVCPDDSDLNNRGQCVCDRGTEGKPGNCQPIEDEPVTPVCPDDSHLNNRGQCVCDRGTEGEPGNCQPIVVIPICPDDSVLNNRGQCVCKRGTEGKPGSCRPIDDRPEPKPVTCPDDSFLNRKGECQCNRGTIGTPGECQLPLRLQRGIVRLN